MSELGVYAAFLKDTLYATCMVLLYVLIRSPVYWLFLLHGLSWVAFVFYYYAEDDVFWSGTVAIVISLSTGAVDFFILLNTLCYLPESTCCLPGTDAAPFTLGAPVCGAGDRYDTPILTWLSVATIGLGIFNAVWRTIGIYNTCGASSIEVGMAALYVATKSYIMGWRGIPFSIFFWLQSCVCISLQCAAVVLGFKYGLRFVANLLLLVALLMDSLVVSGILPTIGTVGAHGSLTGAISGNPFTHGSLKFGGSFGVNAGGANNALPGQITAVWYFLHSLMLLLTLLEILGFLTRDPELPGPFVEANKAALGKDDDDDDDEDGFPEDSKGAKFGANRAAADYGGFRQRPSRRIPI